VRYIAEHRALPSADQRDERILAAMAESIVWYVPPVGMAGPMANKYAHDRASEGWMTLREQLRQQPGYAEPGFLGTPQITEHPSYYSLAALSQLLVINAPLERQVRAGRFVSLILGLLILWIAYLAAQHMFPDQPKLRIGTVAAIALFPNFTMMATSVHNQVMAALAVTLVLYISVRLVRRGLHRGDLVWVALCIAASAVVKFEAGIGVPVALGAVVLASRLGLGRRAWLIASGALIVSLMVVIRPRGARDWYPYINEVVAVPGAEGEHAFAAGDSAIWQTIPQPTAQRLRGQDIIIAAWIRSPSEGDIPLPHVLAGAPGDAFEPLPGSPQVQVGPKWQFYSATLTVPEDAYCMALALPPAELPVYYDGISLATTERPNQNLIVNSSAEQPWWLVRDDWLMRLPRVRGEGLLAVNGRLANFVGWRTNGAAILTATRWLFTTVLSSFLWGIPGLPSIGVAAFAAVTVVSLIGVVRFSISHMPEMPLWQWKALLLVGLLAALSVALGFLRIDPATLPAMCDLYQGRFISNGRYILTGIVPLVMLWVFGLWALPPRRYAGWLLAGAILFLFFLTIFSLLAYQIPFLLRLYGATLP
jgi:hypothetical protein